MSFGQRSICHKKPHRMMAGEYRNYNMNIIKAFEKSMNEYDAIHKSKYWEQYDSRKHLYKEDYLEDFRNNSLSDNLDDRNFNLPEQKEIFCDLLIELGEDFVFRNLNYKNVGNPEQYFKIDNKFVDAGQNFHIKWLHELTNFVFSRIKVNYVCEIGGGYGSFAQKIRSNVDCKYILVDLPEANLLSSYYLSRHFPHLKFLLCDEIQGKSVSKEQIDAYDFIIIPPWYHMNDLKIDLFINTRSMMEMNSEVIKEYFDFIHNTISDDGFFFNINRYYKDKVGYPIKLSEYPYDEKWNVISSKSSWKQDHIHQLITQRSAVDRSGIKEELVKIEEIYQNIKKTDEANAIKNLPLYIKILKKVLRSPLKDALKRHYRTLFTEN